MGADTIVGRPIQVPPGGLLDFLRLQTLGQAPNELLGAIRPTIDLTEFYVNSLAEAEASGDHEITLGSGNQGFQQFTLGLGDILVPQNEFWRVQYWSIITAPLTAGDEIIMQGAIRQNPIAVQRQWAIGEYVDCTGCDTGDRLIWTGRDFWARGGDSLGLYLLKNTLTSATMTFASYIRFVRMHQ